MAKRQGFYNNNNKPFVYQELDGGSSFAIGIDSADSNKVKLQASTSANIDPFSGSQFTIDPSVNGNVTIDPNGSGDTVLASGDLTLSGASKANINLPATSATGTIGVIKAGGFNFLHSGTDTTSVYLGKNAGGTLNAGVNQFNIAIGQSALAANTLGTTSNIVIGNVAGTSITGASGNVIIGTSAAQQITSGSANIVIGPSARASVTGINNIVIGSTSGSNLVLANSSNLYMSNAGANESNTIRIGTTGSGAGQQNRAFIAGVDGVNVGSVAKVLTMASEQVGTATITAGSGISVTPGANTITIAQTTAPAAACNFTAYLAASVTNATGDGTNYDIVFGSTVANVGAAYNTGTGTFTAPNTGLYHFDYSITIQSLLVGHTNLQVLLQGSVNQYSSLIVNPYIMQNASGNLQLTGSVTIPMTAADTMKVRLSIAGSTKTVTVYGQALTGVYTWFTGYQVA